MDRNSAVTQPTSCGSNNLLVVEDTNAQSTAIAHKSANIESSNDLQRINEEQQRPSHRFGGMHRHHSTSSRRRRRRSFDSSVHPTTTLLQTHDSQQLHSTSSTNILQTRYHTHRQSSIRSLQRRPSFESCTTNNNNNESSRSIDIMDFGISTRQLSLYSSFDDTMTSYGGSWEGEVDSNGFLGWGGRSNDNNTDIGSSNRRGMSRGLSNRTILLNEQGKMSERSLSVNSLSTDTSHEELNNHSHGYSYSYSSSGRRGMMRRGGRQESVKTLDSNLEDELVVEVDYNEEDEDEECLVVHGQGQELVVGATKRGLHDQVDRYSSTRAVVHAMNNSDDYCSEASSSTVGVTTRGLQDERYSSTRAVLMGANNNSDDHCCSEDSSSTLEVKSPRRLQEDKYSSTRAVVHAVNGDDQCSAASSSTVGLNPRGFQNDRHSSTRAVLLGASNGNDDESEDISVSTQPIQLSSTREDGRIACTREESIRTLDGNESVYSIDSKGFMAWKNKSQESIGTTLNSGIQAQLSREEELDKADCNTKLVENDKDDEQEEEKGALLVDWDQSKKTDQNSVNGCDGESQICLQLKDKPEDNAADATPRTLESNEVTSNVTNDTPSDFNPKRIKSHPDDNFGNRLTRRMRHVSNRLSSSLTSLRSSSTKIQEETRELANSLPLDLSDSVLERDGGLLVDWDQSEKEKMGALLTLKDSDYYVEEQVLKDGTDTNDDMNPDEDDSDKTLPIEIKQALEADDNITMSGSSSNFQPTQIKVNKSNSNINVGNSLTNHMKHILMSPTRLSSSLTTPSSKRWTQAQPPPSLHDHQRTKSRNLTVSLPSDREYNHFRRSSISLTKSDHGTNERGGLRYLNPQNKKSIGNSLHSVPAISSSLLCEDDEANRPIRLSREDNVNIEELRRELLNNAAAADHDELRRRRSRRKSGFNMFADDLRRELGGDDELNRSRKNKFNLFAMY